jgi:hypothetical protein
LIRQAAGKHPPDKDLAFVEEQMSRSSRGDSREIILSAIDDYVKKGPQTARLFTAIKTGDFSVADLSICPTGSHDFAVEQHKMYTEELEKEMTDKERRSLGNSWRQKCEDFVTQAR